MQREEERRKHSAPGVWGKNLFLPTRKRRDTKEGWLKQKMSATHEVKSDRGSSDLRHREENKAKGEVKHRAGLEHSSDLVKGHSMGGKLSFQ